MKKRRKAILMNDLLCWWHSRRTTEKTDSLSKSGTNVNGTVKTPIKVSTVNSQKHSQPASPTKTKTPNKQTDKRTKAQPSTSKNQTYK
jgi:hypothetical protein